MTTLSLRAKFPAPARGGPARLIAALSGLSALFQTVCEVIDEATDQTAAARRRFPSAD
jgi:hypothetical protein